MSTRRPQPAHRRLLPGDAEAVAEVLARAFRDDPLWCLLFPDALRRVVLARQAFRTFAPSLIAGSVALGVGMPLEGVAVWILPDQAPAPPGTLLSANLLALLGSPFLARFPRAVPVFTRFEVLRRRYAPDPHYYLSTIGVAPGAQGRGLASALIRPMLAEADARGLPAYTETVTPANVPLYEHYGFIVREEQAVPETGLRIWALQRPRQAEIR